MRLEVVAALGVGIGGISLGFAGFAFALFATASLALVHFPQLVMPVVMLLAVQLASGILDEARLLAAARWCEAVLGFSSMPPETWATCSIGAMVLEGRLTPGGGGPAAARAGSARGRGRRQRAF